MEKQFEFSIKGNSVSDLKSVMGTHPISIENINEGLVKEMDKKEQIIKPSEHCHCCGSVGDIEWLDESADWNHMDAKDPALVYQIQQGNCRQCGFATSKRRGE